MVYVSNSRFANRFAKLILMDTNQFHFIAGKIFGLQQSLHKLVVPTHIFILKLNASYHGSKILANKFIHLYIIHELTNGINGLSHLIADLT